MMGGKEKLGWRSKIKGKRTKVVVYIGGFIFLDSIDGDAEDVVTHHMLASLCSISGLPL